jgi:hypothetical protein
MLYILIQVDQPSASRSSLLFLWIYTHTLSNPALNISPFFAGAINASPNTHDAFFFSFTEIVYQTHCISYVVRVFSGLGAFGRTSTIWCDAEFEVLETAAAQQLWF